MINDRKTTLPVHWCQPEESTLSRGDAFYTKRPVQFDMRVLYVNYCHKPVVVKLRNGMAFTVEPEIGMYKRRFVVKVEISMKGKTMEEFHNRSAYIADDDEAPAELKLIKTAFLRRLQENTYYGGTIVLDYPVGMEQLSDNGGTIYLHELDILLSLDSIDRVPHHPYSEAGIRAQTIEAVGTGDTLPGFGYSIMIIDNIGHHGDRYLNINNEIYCLSPKKDLSKRDGVYVVSFNPSERERNVDDAKMKYYTFDQAEEALRLYRTHEDAVALGDLSLEKKRELVTLEHSIQQQKADLQRQKAANDLAMMEMERKLKEAEHEQKLAENQNKRQEEELRMIREREEARSAYERQRSKDFYEQRSHERKDQSEMMKYLPAAIVGIGAIFMALRSMSNGKT